MQGDISNEARKFSEYLSKISKQVDDNGRVQWYLAGSLATMTLSGVESIETVILDEDRKIIGYGERIELSEDDRQRLLSFERKMGKDIDVVNVHGNCFFGAEMSERPYTQNIEKNGIVISKLFSNKTIAGMSYDALNETREIKQHNIVRARMLDGSEIFISNPISQLAYKLVETMYYQNKIKDEDVSEKTKNKYEKDIGDLTSMLYAFSNIYDIEELSKKIFEVSEDSFLEKNNIREILQEVLFSIEKRAEKMNISKEDLNRMKVIIKNLILYKEDKLNIKNIYAEKCPADAIREYIEKIVQSQQEYLKSGKEIPDEMKIPRQIVLTQKNIEFLMNSEYVDYIGGGETGNEIQFFWKKVDEIPVLEVRVKREENGKFYLTYIKEEASKEKDEFVWDRESTDGKKGIITVSKKEEALEDIFDTDINR